MPSAIRRESCAALPTHTREDTAEDHAKGARHGTSLRDRHQKLAGWHQGQRGEVVAC